MLRVMNFPGGPVLKNPPTMRKTQIRPLILKDTTWDKAIKPVSHNY